MRSADELGRLARGLHRWLGGLGAVVTGVMIYGLLMRPPRKFAGFGPDSLIVLIAYAAGVVLLTQGSGLSP